MTEAGGGSGAPDGEAGQPVEPITDERITRNWNELLQELRVLQTGSQILTGFLLTVPFSSRFDALTPFQVRVYLAVLCGAVLTTGFVLAPVAFHRVLFRRSERLWIVETAHRSARTGLGLLALTSAGVLFLVFDVTLGLAAALVAFGVGAGFFVLLWGAVPLRTRRRPSSDRTPGTRRERRSGDVRRARSGRG